jgi:hypothetical protein
MQRNLKQGKKTAKQFGKEQQLNKTLLIKLLR